MTGDRRRVDWMIEKEYTVYRDIALKWKNGLEEHLHSVTRKERCGIDNLRHLLSSIAQQNHMDCILSCHFRCSWLIVFNASIWCAGASLAMPPTCKKPTTQVPLWAVSLERVRSTGHEVCGSFLFHFLPHIEVDMQRVLVASC